MKKVHVKMNKVLAAVLSVLLVCSAVSMDHVFADTVNSGESSGEVSDGVNITEPANGTDADAPTDGTDANGPADVEATAEPTEVPASADVEAAAEPTGTPAQADAAATAEPTETPAEADVEAPAEPTEVPAEADMAAPAEPTEVPVEADVAATAEPTKAPATADVAATAEPTQSPAPANSAVVGVLTASPESMDGAGISTYAADGKYIFHYDGETATSGVMGLNPGDKYGKTKALIITSGASVDVPIDITISEGTVVFDIELLPASKDVQSITFKNSEGKVLFVVCVDAKTSQKIYLSDTKTGSSLVELGAYTANRWCKVRTELYLDDSKDGELQFAVSVSYYADGSNEDEKYDEDVTKWKFVGSATQEDMLKTSSSTNGTVSGTETFDLAAITIDNEGNTRWLGDISLYAITGDITLATAPGTQTAGRDFDPGDAAVKVTYANGESETLKLADMLYEVDYTVEGFDSDTAAADNVSITIYYGGKALTTTVDVKEPEKVMTGIEVKSKPGKTTYKVGESFDKTGLVVQKVLSDGVKEYREELAADSYEVSAPDMDSAGSQTVTVTYKVDEDHVYTCTFRINVEAGAETKTIFRYEGDAANLDELGLTGDTLSIELNTTTVAGNDSQKIKFTSAGAVTKSWEALTKDIVKINLEFNANAKSAMFNICDKQDNALITFGQFGSGNLNLYIGNDNSGTASTKLSGKKNYWIRMETEIDLTASNEKGVLQFTTNIFTKKDYTDEEWVLESTVTQEAYQAAGGTFSNENGCATDTLTEFSVASLVLKDVTSSPGVYFGNIEVLVQEKLPSQSFYYIDQEDISDLKLEAADGVLAVSSSEKGSDETNKLQVNKGTVKKVLDRAITSGTVTFETAGYQNGAIFGIKILDSQGNALINYAQQSSGNLNMYKGTEITGTGNTLNLANTRTNKWIRVVTEIDLDASNEKEELQFEMQIYYKNAYTDEEWTLEKTVTQKEAFLAYNVASGCSTEGLTSFDIKEFQFESQGTSYVDDIYFNDGGGIEGIVTSTKTLQSMKITKLPTVLEFAQGSELNTAGLELTGTYLVEYSDGSPSEIKTYKINKFETEYDFSEIKEESVVTIKVTDNGQVFTETYTVKVTAKPDGSYVTFSYTDEGSAALVGFTGTAISVTSGDIGVDDDGNTSNKIKLNKGTSTLKLANTLSTGTVHFETEFLTTATSGASLFMRILNSEGYPMVDIGQYGSSNLNLYLDKNTSGDFAHRVTGLPVKQWARAEVDIDLDKSNELGYLVFEAVVWTTDDYSSEQWTKFAEFNQDAYINGNGTVHSANGSASTKAGKFDVASIELQNAGSSSNYYDNMFFEAINGNASKVLTGLEIVSPAQKTIYNVGDKANTRGLVLNGTYEYTFSDGSKKQVESRVMKFTASLDSSVPGENVLVTISAGGKTVTYPVTVLPNGNLAQIEEYLVDYVNNVLVSLGEDGEVKVNKRQILLPSRYESGETLSWEVVSGNAEIVDGVLTVNPSEDEATEVVLLVTMQAINEDGDGVVVKKEVTLAVPKDSKQTVDDSMTTEESIRIVLEAMYARGLFSGQANMKDVDAIMASLDRDITTEEIAVMLVNLFDIDTTYADTKIDREDVEEDAWYSKYVNAAFQLSVETRDSREGKKNYGIGQGISEANLRYMVDRIVKIDQTTLPSNYADCMFE